MRKRLFIGLLCITCMFVACVPTPREDSIVNKANGVLEERIGASPVAERPYDGPDSLQIEPFGNDAFQIKVNAAVHIPNTTRYPVMEVEQPFITVERGRDLMSRMADGKPVFTYENEMPQTKAEIAAEIAALQDMLTNPENYFSVEERAEAIEAVQDELKEWQEAYPNAPEQFVASEIDLATMEYDATGQMHGAVDFGKQRAAYLCVVEGGSVSFNNPDDGIGLVFHYDFDNDFSDLNGVTIKKDEAIRIGKEFLQGLGEDTFEPSLVLVGYCTPRGESDLSISQWQQAYVIFFTRAVEGVPTTFYSDDSYDGFLVENEKLYAPPIQQEYVKMIIRDSGVNDMFWSIPTKQTKVLNENVQLLSFDKIMVQFQAQAFYRTAPNLEIETDVIQKELVIDRIDLGMVQIRKKNYPDTMLMIPVWTFFGYIHVTYAQPHTAFITGVSSEKETIHHPGYVYMMINAIDGSVIDPVRGY
jgi:hypothetical protein